MMAGRMHNQGYNHAWCANVHAKLAPIPLCRSGGKKAIGTTGPLLSIYLEVGGGAGGIDLSN